MKLAVLKKKYQIILADPPWDYFSKGGEKLNAKTNGKEVTDHYNTMTDDEVINFPGWCLSDKNSALFMWTTHSKLPIALKAMEAWDFRYITVGFEWLKRTSTGKPVCFMGHWVCGGAIELCLFGKKGTPKRISRTVRRLVDAPRGQHSAKPPEVRDRIVSLFGDLPRIELFAREKIPGWDVYGDQVEGSITLYE